MKPLAVLALACLLTGATPAPLAAPEVQSATAAPREAQPVRTPVSSGRQVAPVTAGLLGAPLVPDGSQSVRGEVRESAVGWYHYPDPVPGGAPQPSSGLVPGIVSGLATWYVDPKHPDGLYAAAGPHLRSIPGWRGKTILVTRGDRSTLVRLSDACWCPNRDKGAVLLDLSRDAFARLGSLSEGVIRVEVLLVTLPATDTTGVPRTTEDLQMMREAVDEAYR